MHRLALTISCYTALALGCNAFTKNVPLWRSALCSQSKNMRHLKSSFRPSTPLVRIKSTRVSVTLDEEASDESDRAGVEADGIAEKSLLENTGDDTFDQVATTHRSLLQRLKKSFGGEKFSRKFLAKLGTSVLLSYGFVSNIFAITCVSIAWFLSCRRTGLSPLAPGQWKGFTAVYAGFFVFLSVIRPARFALAAALSKYFDRILNGIQSRFGCNEAVAAGILLSCNICFNFAYLAVGVATASMFSGVPVWRK